MKKFIFVLGACFVLFGSNVIFGQEMERKEVSLTVYNQNFALVRDLRFLNLKEGLNQVRFSDIASQIDATSVNFKSLTAPAECSILEQNFEYDLVNADKLLQKYIDKEIKIITQDSEFYQGFLSSYDSNQLVLVKDKEKGPVFMVNRANIRNLEFPQLPEGLITKPTLVWSLQNAKSGQHLVELSYLTNGMSWRADYVASVTKDDKNISLNAWVTINNNSGVGYQNAGLKLIAGDVHRVTEQPAYQRSDMMMEAKSMAAGAPFEEKSFFEYHLYTLQRKTDLKNNQTKQITLFTAPRVPVEKIYTYDGALYRWYYYDNWQKQSCNKKVEVKLDFKNSEKNGLGIPLPKGKIKVYKADSDDTLQFIGEDQIDHTPKDEKVSISMGNAFDVVGERKITNHKMVTTNLYRDTYEIALRNHKKEAITVKAVEHQWGDWNIIQSSHKYTKKDAFTLEFNVPVEKDGETIITYTAEYKF
ncbi:MAG: DUF4139 domain-containing protein [Candidatus Omnitrophica bacterium]|nr:DUF4139 domain-containing protein [Candidatus Omnitrophota bacterium]